MAEAKTVAEILQYYDISYDKYKMYCKIYGVKFNKTGKPRGWKWITNGVIDLYHQIDQPFPDGFWSGKSKNKPPIKSKYKS